MNKWFGPIKTLHNPPPEALYWEVVVFGPVRKGDTIELKAPIIRDMILNEGPLDFRTVIEDILSVADRHNR